MSLKSILYIAFIFFSASGFASEASPLPIALDFYADGAAGSLWEVLAGRMSTAPFNLIATVIFLCAIVHTFLASTFNKKSHALELAYKKAGHEGVSFKAAVFHFLGEVEVVFGLWAIPLMILMAAFYGTKGATSYLQTKVSFTEPLFVMVIMAIASTRPVLHCAQGILGKIAHLGNRNPIAWWWTLLTVAPLLGSFITEPAAMTIAALLLAKQFYVYGPSKRLAYGTLGLLFVNVSVGGTLTHFAAPPVVMVADRWHIGLLDMFLHLGIQAAAGILISTAFYAFIFRADLRKVASNAAHQSEHADRCRPIPLWVAAVHLLFVAWTVINLHQPVLFVAGFLFFLGFTQASANHQEQLSLRGPLLVGFFLAGLVVHGTLQSWWIEPVLSRMGEWGLFATSTVLTSFNDNAAITFLASLVPDFAHNQTLQHAVLAGAVTGGGLTVIANAPNPAGQSLLSKFFPDGVSPAGLFLGALAPTLIVAVCFMSFK